MHKNHDLTQFQFSFFESILSNFSIGSRKDVEKFHFPSLIQYSAILVLIQGRKLCRTNFLIITRFLSNIQSCRLFLQILFRQPRIVIASTRFGPRGFRAIQFRVVQFRVVQFRAIHPAGRSVSG